ncbi:MAG: dihydroorotate dehydrogenase electron transfer subunit [Candidatus Bathyarchaeia archaeon]
MSVHTKKGSPIPPEFDAINRMRTVEVLGVKTENCAVKTFTFKDALCKAAESGQFVMVWVPGVDEIPISLSGISGDGTTLISVHGVGDASNALNQKQKGDIIGIRGPFGNGFVPVKGNVMVVGGGTGIGPLMPLMELLVNVADKVTVMSGVKSKENLLFLERISQVCSCVDSETVFTTEDGSYQSCGFVTDQVELKLRQEKFDMIYTCGPEVMMYKVFCLAEQYNVLLQASLERMMRCAIGLCGSCQVGRLRVCKDGPVFSSEQLRNVKDEFGKYRLDATGNKIKQP